jgi:hypothetical protein
MTLNVDEVKMNIKDIKESNQSPKISETLLNTNSQCIDIKYISENSVKQNDEVRNESSLAESQYPNSSMENLEKSNNPEQENENSYQKLEKDYFLEADKYLEMYLDKKKSFQPEQFPRYGISEASTQTILTMRELDDLQAKKTISDSELFMNIFQKSPDLFPKIYSKFVYENVLFDRKNIPFTPEIPKDLPRLKEPKSTDTFSLSKSRKNTKKITENSLSFSSQKQKIIDLDLNLSMNNHNSNKSLNLNTQNIPVTSNTNNGPKLSGGIGMERVGIFFNSNIDGGNGNGNWNSSGNGGKGICLGFGIRSGLNAHENEDREKENDKLTSRKRKNPLNYYDFNKNGIIYKNGFEASYNNNNMRTNANSIIITNTDTNTNSSSLPIRKNLFFDKNSNANVNSNSNPNWNGNDNGNQNANANSNSNRFSNEIHQTKFPIENSYEFKITAEDISNKNKNKILMKRKIDNRRKIKSQNLHKPHLHFSKKHQSDINKINDNNNSNPHSLSISHTNSNSKSKKLENIRNKTQVNFKNFEGKEAQYKNNINFNSSKNLSLNENDNHNIDFNKDNNHNDINMNININTPLLQTQKEKDNRNEKNDFNNINNFSVKKTKIIKTTSNNNNYIPNPALDKEKNKHFFNTENNQNPNSNLNSNINSVNNTNDINNAFNLINPSNNEDFSRSSNVDNSFLRNNNNIFTDQLANDLNQNNSSFLSFDLNNEIPQNFSNRSIPIKLRVIN